MVTLSLCVGSVAGGLNSGENFHTQTMCSRGQNAKRYLHVLFTELFNMRP